MLTRSSERIFNQMRYTDFEWVQRTKFQQCNFRFRLREQLPPTPPLVWKFHDTNWVIRSKILPATRTLVSHSPALRFYFLKNFCKNTSFLSIDINSQVLHVTYRLGVFFLTFFLEIFKSWVSAAIYAITLFSFLWIFWNA